VIYRPSASSTQEKSKSVKVRHKAKTSRQKPSTAPEPSSLAAITKSRQRIINVVPFPASDCMSGEPWNYVKLSGWPVVRSLVWGNRFAVQATFSKTGITVVEYSYWHSSRDDTRFFKETLWFSQAGIDALAAAGWTVEDGARQ
jgi:hypothetical protein